MGLLLALTAYAFYAMALSTFTAPYIAAEFALDDAAITAVAGWISLGAFGTALLTRLADRHGRRRVLVGSFAALPVFALASACATGVAGYVVPQIGANAMFNTLATALAVAVAEEASDAKRAAAQSWFGIAASGGGALALGLGTILPWLPGGWRVFWIVAALPLFALPLVRARLLETERFTVAQDDGRVAATRGTDLLRGPWRRRTIGLLAVGLLKPVGITATATWPYYHMVKTLGIDPGWAALVYCAGGALGIAGNPLGARLTDAWGRRPTSVAASALAVGAGCAFFFVPAGHAFQIPLLMLFMALTLIATSVFSVADRCIDAELFPTALRATYVGAARLMNAASNVATMFALSALAKPLGGLPTAIAVLSVATLVPALAIFLAVVPETRGMTLEQASLDGRRDAA